MTQEMLTRPAQVAMEIIVRDKDGNVKYAGPLTMDVVSVEPEQTPTEEK